MKGNNAVDTILAQVKETTLIAGHLRGHVITEAQCAAIARAATTTIDFSVALAAAEEEVEALEVELATAHQSLRPTIDIDLGRSKRRLTLLKRLRDV